MGGSLFFHLQEFKNCSNLLWFQVFHCVIHVEGGRKQLAPLSLSLSIPVLATWTIGGNGGGQFFWGSIPTEKEKKEDIGIPFGGLVCAVFAS